MYWYTNLPDKLKKTPKRGRSMTYKGIMYLYCTLLYSVPSPPLVPSRGHTKLLLSTTDAALEYNCSEVATFSNMTNIAWGPNPNNPRLKSYFGLFSGQYDGIVWSDTVTTSHWRCS